MSTSPITHQPNLILSPATLADVPSLRQVWYACFTSPTLRKMFPDTPAQHSWWDATNTADILHHPSSKILVVKDESPEGSGRVVGYAKWSVPIGAERLDVNDIFPPWSSEGDDELLERCFRPLGEERKRIMGERQYYFLDVVGTIPEYRRLGVASMLIGWGVDCSDRDGLEAYVDASDEGKPVYEKFGFISDLSFNLDGDGFTCSPYIRPPRK